MSLARNVATVGSATIASRLLGFARDLGVAALLGAGPLSDAYLAALQIPNLFRRLLADGALNSAFVPLWLRRRDEQGAAAARRFGENVLGLLLLGIGAVTVLCVLFAPFLIGLLAPGFDPAGERHMLAVDYLRLSIGYAVIAGALAVWAAALNADGRVTAVAFGGVVFNCALVGAVLLLILSDATAEPRTGAILSATVAIAGLAQLVLIGAAMLAMPNAPLRPRFAPTGEGLRFFALALPGMLAAGVPQLKLMAGAVIASSSPNAVSWLYYANRLYELPLGIVSIATASVLVPLIAKSLRDPQGRTVADAQARGFEIALGLSLPAAVALVVLAAPIVHVLFEHGVFGASDTLAVAAALAAIAAGLPGHALEKAIGAVSFAHEDTRTPMLAALAGLATAIIVALLLFPAHGHVGIAAAIAISGWVGALTLAVVLWTRGWLAIDTPLLWRLGRIVLAAALMGLVLWALQRFVFVPSRAASTGARIALLAALVCGGLGFYLSVLQVLGVLQWRELMRALRRRA